MSRYVKADMIGCPCGYCEGYKECQEEVDSAPSIDIVRCGECKLGGTEDCPMDEIDDEYFCNFGERKEQ